MPLKQRFMLTMALLLLLSLVAGAVVSYWRVARQIETEMASALKQAESSLATIVASLPAGGDQESLNRAVSSFDGERHVRISLIDHSATVVRQSQLAAPEDPVPGWFHAALVGHVPVSNVSLPEKWRTYGTIRIEADPSNEIVEIWEDGLMDTALLAGLFSLVLFFVYSTLGRALKPLENLRGAFAEIGHGNFAAQVSETGPEEFRSIYRQFNKMAAGLADAERKNRALNEQLLTVQEEERADIARDLHDEIGPFLFAVDVDAQTIPTYLEKDAIKDARGRAEAIRQSVAHMQTHLRSILTRLRPVLLLDLGLSPAVEQLVEFWSNRHPDIEFDLKVSETGFGAVVDEVAYRVVQEAVNNAVRHGKPQHIAIRISVDGESLGITVEDDGGGFQNLASATSSTGFGLAGMRERLSAVGGSMAIEVAESGGVALRAEIPLKQAGGKSETRIGEGAQVQ